MQRHRPRGNHLEILEVGPYPPPRGGVSIHLERLIGSLRKADVAVGVANHFAKPSPTAGMDRSFVVVDLNKNPVRYLLSIRRLRCQLLHHHYSRLSTLIGNVLALKRTGCEASIVSLHAGRIVRQLDRTGGWPITRLRRRLLAWGLSRFDTVIVVNEEMKVGVSRAVPGVNVVVIPAYIPPAEAEVVEPLSNEALDFIGGASELITISSYGLPFTIDPAADDYGVDVAVGAFLRLARDRAGLRLALFTSLDPSEGSGRRYIDDLVEEVAKRGAGGRFAVFTGEPLLPAIARSDVFIRPSRTDGDALSIREALSLGVPVAASDCVARPDGAMLVPTGDVEKWAEAINASLSGRGNRPSRVPDGVGPALSLLQVYEGLATGALKAKLADGSALMRPPERPNTAS